MEFVIDNREKKVIDKISKNDDIKYKLENLPLGDFSFKIDGKDYILIERKTVKDLSSSIKDGRYKEQKIRLTEKNKEDVNIKIIYLIEGNINEKVGGIPSSTFYSVIINSMIRDNIYTYVTKDINETVKILTKIFNFLLKNKDNLEINSKNNSIDKEIEYASCIKSIKKENLTPKVCYINQLCQIPGVSNKIASSITNIYPTMHKLISKLEIDEEDLLSEHKVGNRKIGKKLSEKIFKFLCK